MLMTRDSGTLRHDHAAEVTNRNCGHILRACRGQRKCKCHQRVSEGMVTDAITKMQVYAREALAKQAMEQEKASLGQELQQTASLQSQMYAQKQQIEATYEQAEHDYDETTAFMFVSLALGIALVATLAMNATGYSMFGFIQRGSSAGSATEKSTKAALAKLRASA